MSIECSECGRNARAEHGPDCSRRRSPLKCQNFDTCGDFCETEGQVEWQLCEGCLDTLFEGEKDQFLADAMKNALIRIAVAADMKRGSATEIADVVCAKLASISDHQTDLFEWISRQVLLFRGNNKPLDEEAAERCARTIMNRIKTGGHSS